MSSPTTPSAAVSDAEPPAPTPPSTDPVTTALKSHLRLHHPTGLTAWRRRFPHGALARIEGRPPPPPAPPIEFDAAGYPTPIPAEHVPVHSREQFAAWRYCSVCEDAYRQWEFYRVDTRVCIDCQDARDGGETGREVVKYLLQEKMRRTVGRWEGWVDRAVEMGLRLPGERDVDAEMRGLFAEIVQRSEERRRRGKDEGVEGC